LVKENRIQVENFIKSNNYKLIFWICSILATIFGYGFSFVLQNYFKIETKVENKSKGWFW
jgi:hypothetical protein